MGRVDVSTWTADQIYEWEQLFYRLKEEYGDRPLVLTPEQRDIAVQLGLMPPLSAMAEVTFDGKRYRGLLSLGNDDIYRGAIYLKRD